MIWTKAHCNPSESDEPHHTNLNNIADELATIARNRTLDGSLQPVQHDLFPGAKASLATMDGYLIHNNRHQNLKRHCSWTEMKCYLCRKHDWEEKTFNMARWNSVRRAMRAKKSLARPGIIKMIHNWHYNNH